MTKSVSGEQLRAWADALEDDAPGAVEGVIAGLRSAAADVDPGGESTGVERD